MIWCCCEVESKTFQYCTLIRTNTFRFLAIVLNVHNPGSLPFGSPWWNILEQYEGSWAYILATLRFNLEEIPVNFRNS